MKILSSEQIRDLDSYTIKNGIPSIDLMEQASQVFFDWIIPKIDIANDSFSFFCGTGNNGGDGLVVARILSIFNKNIDVFILKFGKGTEDFNTNLERLKKCSDISIHYIKKGDSLPIIKSDSIIIDAIFGSGLNRSVDGYWAKLFNQINDSESKVFALDIPSGLFSNSPSKGAIIKASKTFTFESPKLAFLFPENEKFVGDWEYGNIGMDSNYKKSLNSIYNFVEKKDIKSIIKIRSKFGHKGNYGHALLIAGSKGMMGAAVLAAKSCLRSGPGLVTVHIPNSGNNIMQISTPEVMLSLDIDENVITSIPDLERFNSIGIGCGLGNSTDTILAIKKILSVSKIPLIIDADGLNIISNNGLIDSIPKGSLLTPHIGEFKRLFGNFSNSFERLMIQVENSTKRGIYILTKGLFSCLTTPDGQVYFNSTGNSGMATGGSGDVLTGIITGLIARGYKIKEAAKIGMYLHGLSGDNYADRNNKESLIAGDIIDGLVFAFNEINE